MRETMPRSSKPKSEAFLVIPSTGKVVSLTMQQAQPFLGEAAIASATTAPKAGKGAPKPTAKAGKKAAPAKAAKAGAPPDIKSRASQETTKATKPRQAKNAVSGTKPAKPAKAVATPPEATKSAASMRDVQEAAKRVLLRHGKPMPRRELFKILTTGRNSLAIAGKDPVENMATMLYKDKAKSFENLKGQGFWVKGEPLPSSGQTETQS